MNLPHTPKFYSHIQIHFCMQFQEFYRPLKAHQCLQSIDSELLTYKQKFQYWFGEDGSTMVNKGMQM